MSAETMLAKCRSYLGYQEEPPGSNVTLFGLWYGISPGAWCAMYLSYCAAMTGNDAAVGRFASTRAWADWWFTKGQWGTTPKVGAIIFYDWEGGRLRGGIDHVGIVEAVNSDGSVTTIEGNTNDICARRVRRAFIVGYGYPDYQSEVVTPTTMRTMFDAAYPPGTPPQVDAVAGYIGGNTPNVWTDAEWASMMTKSGAKYKLPIFVRSTGGDPVADAAASVRWAVAHGQPKGTLIAMDYETRIDATYLNRYDAGIVAGGYKCVVYGSRTAVLQNPKPSGGYWTATWNNIPHLDVGAVITQYGGDTTLGKNYDLNVVADSAPLWGGTVVEEFLMALSDTEQARVLAAANQVLGAVGTGQTNYSGTIEATLGGVQSLHNKVTAVSSTVQALVASSRDDVLAALAALPAPAPGSGGATAEQIADVVLAAIAAKWAAA